MTNQLRSHAPRLALAWLLLLALPWLGCKPQDPVERVAEMRAHYTAEVNPSGFVARPRQAEPPATESTTAGEPGDETAAQPAADAPPTAGDNTAGDDGTGEETAAEPTAPPRYDVILDMLIKNDNRENLPQLTLDIVQTDLAGNEVTRYRATIDSSKITRGMVTQVSYTLEDIEFHEGEQMFYVQVRPVPPEERSLYPEFNVAS